MLKHSTTLKPGATAPDFSLPTNRGDQRTLAELSGPRAGAAGVSSRHLVTQLSPPVR